ncbi:MAG: DUF1415 domain-containing protein [Burkholderiaceae bacterium]|nr:DUF1415 domain-containing protein [Burkholderiaceae bacterium]
MPAAADSPTAHDPADPVIAATRAWLEKAVIGLNLCPFAKAVHVSGRIRWRVSAATTADGLLADLGDELRLLVAADPEVVDTTLLIHPYVLGDFLDYNDFLDVADAALDALGLAEVLQVASFHPQYQFADTAPDDISNYTNRSPYPMLHLLRHASVDRAVAAFPDASAIFDVNIETMRRLGREGWRKLMGGDAPLPDLPER